MVILTVNSKTGEVSEVKVESPFASLQEPRCKELKDGEDYVPGTSVTTLEGYEPLESIVARCMRTVKSPNGTVYNVLDTDALKAEETMQGIYEAEGAKTVDEAFATMDPTDEQGFDLADASRIGVEVNTRLSDSQKESELSTKGASAPLNSEVSDVVGNSADSEKSEEFPEKKGGE